MSLQRVPIGGFHRGLVTDDIGVDGALLEANDIWIDRRGEIRKRGGKGQVLSSLITNGTTCLRHFFHPDLGGAFVAYDASTYQMVKLNIAATAATTIGPFSTKDHNNTVLTGSSNATADYPSQSAVFDDEIVFGNNLSKAVTRWCGCTQDYYNTGTIALADGSTTVTGSGTTWVAGHVGAYMYINTGSVNERVFRVISVDTVAQTLTLDAVPITGSSPSGVSYGLNPIGRVSSPDGVFYAVGAAGVNYVGSSVLESHRGRLFVADMYDSSGQDRVGRIRWSAIQGESSDKFVGIDYWHANGYLDIGDAVGQIRIMKSFQGQLLVVGSQGVGVLSGDFATDGTDLGARFDLLRVEPFTNIWWVAGVTPLGVVWAGGRGLNIWDGASISSLTDGAVGQFWRQEEAGVSTVSISSVPNRIIVQIYGSPTLVYYIEQGVWVTQTRDSSVYGHTEVHHYPTSGAASGYEVAAQYSGNAIDDWSADHTTANKNDIGNTSAPRIAVTTHPVSLADHSWNARPQLVHVDGHIEDAASDNPTLDVKLIAGDEGTSAGGEADITVGSIAEGTYSTPHRLRVGGAPPAPSYRVNIEQTNAAADARIYGISLDVSGVNRVRG